MLNLAIGEDSKSIRNRLEGFAKELDDRYAQWELIRSERSKEEERTFLEDQLRSPLEMEPAP